MVQLKRLGLFRFCCLIFTAFICIALPTFLMGCNPDISISTCINLFEIKSTTVAYHYKKNICSKCDSYATVCNNLYSGITQNLKIKTKIKSCKSTCIHFSYYDCYNVDVVEKYNKNNKEYKCNVNIVQREHDLVNAQLYVTNRYPINGSINIYVNKHTHSCETEQTGKTLTIIGILFFSLAGCVCCMYGRIICGLQSHVKILSSQSSSHFTVTNELPQISPTTTHPQPIAQTIHYPPIMYQVINMSTQQQPQTTATNIPHYPVNYKTKQIVTSKFIV